MSQAAKAGDLINCPHCRQQHAIYGPAHNQTLYYTCDDKIYLAAVNGRVAEDPSSAMQQPAGCNCPSGMMIVHVVGCPLRTFDEEAAVAAGYHSRDFIHMFLGFVAAKVQLRTHPQKLLELLAEFEGEMKAGPGYLRGRDPMERVMDELKSGGIIE